MLIYGSFSVWDDDNCERDDIMMVRLNKTKNSKHFNNLKFNFVKDNTPQMEILSETESRILVLIPFFLPRIT